MLPPAKWAALQICNARLEIARTEHLPASSRPPSYQTALQTRRPGRATQIELRARLLRRTSPLEQMLYLPPVNGERYAGEIACACAGEERERRGKLLGLADTPERGPGRPFILYLLSRLPRLLLHRRDQVFKPVGAGVAGQDRVDGDAPRGRLLRRGFWRSPAHRHAPRWRDTGSVPAAWPRPT